MRWFLLLGTVTATFLGGLNSPLAMESLKFDRHAVTVIDGDTIQVHDRVLQLSGIDTPELGQACDHNGHYWLCGLAAAYELQRLIGFQNSLIQCSVDVSDDLTDRAECKIGGEDLVIPLILSGFATVTVENAPYYQGAQEKAQRASLGIWGGEFVPPSDWRNSKRLPGEHKFGIGSKLHGDLPWKLEGGDLVFDPKAEHSACLVKGIVEADRTRVYYGPLDKEYGDIHVDPRRGDQLFCGDDLARISGWRHKGVSPAS